MQHRVGKDASLAADSPDRRFSGIFEDDGDTGYFYGAQFSETEAGKFTILDALHIYNVAAVVDKQSEYPIEIRWAANQHRVGLFIEGYCHAVFDFDAKRAACRDGFPPASGNFASTHEWDEALLEGL
jgi:hypothetical protein